MGKLIDRVGVRKTLAPRREPYWKRLEQGRYIGYRRLSSATPGKWIARPCAWIQNKRGWGR